MKILHTKHQNKYEYQVHNCTDIQSLDSLLKSAMSQNADFVYRSYRYKGDLMFTIYKKLDLVNSFNPLFEGTAKVEEDGLKIKGTFKYHVFTKLILIWMYAFLGIMLIIVCLGDLNEITIHLNSPTGSQAVTAPGWYGYAFIIGFLALVAIFQFLGTYFSMARRSCILQLIESIIC